MESSSKKAIYVKKDVPLKAIKFTDSDEENGLTPSDVSERSQEEILSEELNTVVKKMKKRQKIKDKEEPKPEIIQPPKKKKISRKKKVSPKKGEDIVEGEDEEEENPIQVFKLPSRSNRGRKPNISEVDPDGLPQQRSEEKLESNRRRYYEHREDILQGQRQGYVRRIVKNPDGSIDEKKLKELYNKHNRLADHHQDFVRRILDEFPEYF